MISNEVKLAIGGTAILVIAAGGYWYWLSTRPAPHAIDAQPPVVAEQVPTAPQPQFPVAAESDDASREPLPPLASSDTAFGAALESVIPSSRDRQLLQPDNAIQRWVVSIDALAKGSMSQRLRPVSRFNDAFIADAVPDQADEYLLSPANYKRYEPILSLAERVDLDAAVAAYRRFYPLFQQAYTDVIDPKGYFNDRLIAVIDHLLATRDVTAGVRLVRPSVMYQFSDPALESMSVGQKAMVRMGPENAQRVKALLRTLRTKLAQNP